MMIDLKRSEIVRNGIITFLVCAINPPFHYHGLMIVTMFIIDLAISIIISMVVYVAAKAFKVWRSGEWN